MSDYPGGGTPPAILPIGTPEGMTTTTVAHHSDLPYTGGDALGLAGIGLLLVVLGVAAVRMTRRAVAR